MTEHTASSCSTKMDIGKIINGDELIKYFKDKCAFKPIETQCCMKDMYVNLFIHMKERIINPYHMNFK